MYAKIFRQIFESSIAEDPRVRFTFIDLLILADKDGVVDMTHEAISRITNVPLDWVKSSIEALESPDKRSRTPESDGARIVRLDEHRDWGWLIVNYNRFRGIANEAQRKEGVRERVSAYRRRIKQQSTPPCNGSVTPCNENVTLPYAYVCTDPPSETGGVGGEGKQAALLKLLYPIYKREPGKPPSYAESYAAIAIVRNPNWEKEAGEILNWRSKLNSDLKYFPHSLVRLLTTWDEVLDRARTQKPKPKGYVE